MSVVAAIRSWLEASFPESNVRLEEDPAREIVRFLIEDRAGGRARVFEVAGLTLDGDPSGVVQYLTNQAVASRLRDEPTWRARLKPGDSLEFFQQMHLRCDGKSYYVFQTADRKLLLTDARHRPLAGSPTTSTTFDGDITTVPAADWQQRIRSWRGADQ